MTYELGSIVKARSREWVVLPSDDPEVLRVRPLSGNQEYEVTGLLRNLESIEPSTFDLPGVNDLGDHLSAQLLLDASTLSARSTVGPFRSLARIGVTPRTYQIVPLLMALKMSTVRMLIADDVGIGKTIEALLIARELYDRGEVARLAVLCPPVLAEQWKGELARFNINAELVLAGTAARLERSCPQNVSLFEHYPFTVVSLDYIKSDKHREEFIRTCPEFVIVDEAHTCAPPAASTGSRHLRWTLLKRIAEEAERHVVLVTATPHSGNEFAFDRLIEVLDPTLLADELSSEKAARRLARHFVQRRRADIEHYLDEDTSFPRRVEAEATYVLGASRAYETLMKRAIAFVRASLQEEGNDAFRQRVTWWSGLALLRALGSSPRAAAVTMRNRAAAAAARDGEELEEIGRRSVMDEDASEESETVDVSPGAQVDEDEQAAESSTRRRSLLDMARQAEAIAPNGDPKLQVAIENVAKLVKEGFSPIVFCRFIETAHYVRDALEKAIPSATVTAVTGELPPSEREDRVRELGAKHPRILVATDCLSEGVNLQESFTAVVHYDLSWNPTRHEQREGRVDRFGQKADAVRALTIYGSDNAVDGLVLEVLIRKHKAIKTALNVNVSVPMETNDVLEALLEGLILRADWSGDQSQLEFPELASELKPRRDALHTEWEKSAEREKLSRSRFAQHVLRPDEVRQELRAAEDGVGTKETVERFVRTSLAAYQIRLDNVKPGVTVAAQMLPPYLRDMVGPRADRVSLAFDNPAPEGWTGLTRTSSFVGRLSERILEAALSGEGSAQRAGVCRTRAVDRRATLLLVRFRYKLSMKRGWHEKDDVCDETVVAAYAGDGTSFTWFGDDDARALLSAEPAGNVMPEQAHELLRSFHESYHVVRERLVELGQERAELLRESHARVREASRSRAAEVDMSVLGDPDVLGVYVFIPAPGGAR